MKINERWEELKEESNANIQSEEGILKRQTRSIQTEGHFGDIKEKSHFTILYMTESEKGMDYNIKDNPEKVEVFIDNEYNNMRK